MTRTTPEQRAALARDVAYAREHGHLGRILRSYYDVDDAAAFLADAEALANLTAVVQTALDGNSDDDPAVLAAKRQDELLAARADVARLRKLCGEAAMSLLCQCEACDAMRASLRAAEKGGEGDG